MAVLDAPWWGVWWPWMLIWAATVGSVAAAVTIAVTHWRRHRRTAAARLLLLGALYLDDERVMNLYHLNGGKYTADLRQEVEEEITSNREADVSAELAPLIRAGGSRSVNERVFRRYVQVATSIAVIGIVIDVLDKADDIVKVDMGKREVTRSGALDKILDAAGDQRSHRVRLSDVELFVSVRGRFRRTEQPDSTTTDPTTTFQASYGRRTGPHDGPHVHVTCVSRGLLDDVPPGSFKAHCLGTVGDWDPQRRRLVLRPLAIFY